MSYDPASPSAPAPHPTVWDVVRFVLIFMIVMVIAVVVLGALLAVALGEPGSRAFAPPSTPRDAWIWLAGFAAFYVAVAGSVWLAMLPHKEQRARALAFVPVGGRALVLGSVAVVILSLLLDQVAAPLLQRALGGGVESQVMGLIRTMTQTPALAVAATIVLAGLAPLGEELVFRGLLFGWIRAHWPFWATALVTSALFGLAHGEPAQAVMTGMLGLVLAYLRERTGSLWCSIAAHMLNNLVAVASVPFLS